MTKDAIRPRKVATDSQRGRSLVVATVVGQHASVGADSVPQHASTAAGAGVQHVDSGSWINLISLVTISPIDNIRFID
jgi:hypothetical protein